MCRTWPLLSTAPGVTAGDGEDGRIKSAIGIGTLLEDGITIPFVFHSTGKILEFEIPCL